MPDPNSSPTSPPPVLEVRNLCVHFSSHQLLRDVNLEIREREVFGLFGPSGAGKSTLLRCLNLLTCLDRSLRVSGDILFHGRSILAPGVDPDALRARIGILFQQPVIFPASVLQNTLFGVRHLGTVPRPLWPGLAERALRDAALWDEVKDRLQAPAIQLSTGQQQRLCLARTLAVDPEVILMDEPTSALDPTSTQLIENLITSLKITRTLVLVTHNLAQARRLCDRAGFLTAGPDGTGRLACAGPMPQILSQPGPPELQRFLQAGNPHPPGDHALP